MKFRRRRRAVSYIMEVVMMTLVITALASVVLTWGMNAVSTSRAALTGAVNARIDRIQESMVIEDVQMISTTSARVWIMNTGSIQIVVDQVYVNNIQAPIVAVCAPGQSPSGAGAGSCPTSASKLSLPIQSYGAVDVTVPSSVVTPIVSGTATGGTTTTISDSSASWSVNKWSGCTVAITAGTDAGQSSTISSNTGSDLTVSPAWAAAPDSTSHYTIMSAGMCSGGTYTISVSTSRGTISQGAFTV